MNKSFTFTLSVCALYAYSVLCMEDNEKPRVCRPPRTNAHAQVSDNFCKLTQKYKHQLDACNAIDTTNEIKATRSTSRRRVKKSKKPRDVQLERETLQHKIQLVGMAHSTFLEAADEGRGVAYAADTMIYKVLPVANSDRYRKAAVQMKCELDGCIHNMFNNMPAGSSTK